MSDLETRLKSQLGSQSQGLPDAEFSVGSVMAGGRRRRRRNRAIATVGIIGLLAGLASVAVPLADSMGGRSESVFADQPQAPDGTGREVVDPTAAPDQEEQGMTPVLEVDPAPAPATEADPSTTVLEPGPGPEPELEPGGPAWAIDQLPADAVLFHSDNEDCADIADGRAHPDWVEGQPGDGRNDDGTPTYGFAFNTGDTTTGEIDWRITELPEALSGRCVVSMTLNQADDRSDAIRLFRRYDRNGDQLPADAYYSVWLYFPKDIVYENQATVDGQPGFGFWNVFQIKNDVDLADGQRSMSAVSFDAGRTPEEEVMSLSAYNKVLCGSADDCEDAYSIEQSEPMPIPVGQWVHFELRLLSRPDASGRIQVWQDGALILDHQGQTERVNTARRTWSLTHMGHLHRTPSHTLYADDPLISSEPIHPLLFD